MSSTRAGTSDGQGGGRALEGGASISAAEPQGGGRPRQVGLRWKTDSHLKIALVLLIQSHPDSRVGGTFCLSALCSLRFHESLSAQDEKWGWWELEETDHLCTLEPGGCGGLPIAQIRDLLSLKMK